MARSPRLRSRKALSPAYRAMPPVVTTSAARNRSRARVARRLHAAQRIEPAEGRGLQRGLAAQVGDRAAGLVRRGQGRVQGAAHAQLDVAAAGQRQAAVGCMRPVLPTASTRAWLRDLAQAVADQAGLLPAGIAAHVHAQVAAAQRAEAGEAAQFVGGLVDVAGHVSAEVDPPGGGCAWPMAAEPDPWRQSQLPGVSLL